MTITVNAAAIKEASDKLSNWGRWGKDDQIGTLNHVTPQDIVSAGKLIKQGKVFALGIPLDRSGPQTGLFGGRFNPIHQMLATGTDAIASDTWGCEVRPNETKDANQPWPWVVIPAMGLCMGEIFYLKELAEDCAKDKVYEFFFCGPPLIITGGTGSPINPQAIK